MRFCLECGKEITRRKFCSIKCSTQYRVKNSNVIDKDLLIQEYINDKLELTEISLRHKVSVATICHYLKRYSIPTRPNYIDFSGRKIGKLQIIEPIEMNYKGGGKHVKWRCVCECGNECVTYSHHLSRCLHMQCRRCADISRRSKQELKVYMWNSLKRSALNRGIDFNIEREWAYDLFLKQDKKCAISGVDIKFAVCAADHKQKNTTASLDRINSSEGYVKGNVQWIHKTVNFMKGAMNDEDLLKWCKQIVNHAMLAETL